MAVLADARSQHARLRERRYRHAFKEVVQAWLFKLSEREWIEIFFFTRSPGGHRVSQWAISKIPPPRKPSGEMQGILKKCVGACGDSQERDRAKPVTHPQGEGIGPGSRHQQPF